MSTLTLRKRVLHTSHLFPVMLREPTPTSAHCNLHIKKIQNNKNPPFKPHTGKEAKSQQQQPFGARHTNKPPKYHLHHKNIITAFFSNVNLNNNSLNTAQKATPSSKSLISESTHFHLKKPHSSINIVDCPQNKYPLPTSRKIYQTKITKHTYQIVSKVISINISITKTNPETS